MLMRGQLVRTLVNRGAVACRYLYSTDVIDEQKPFTYKRGTADHTLPGLTQLRKACQKLKESGITHPEAAVEQLKEEVGRSVALGQYVMNIDHPEFLATIERLRQTGYTFHQILDDPRLLSQSAPASLQSRKINEKWLDKLAEKLGTTVDELLLRAPAKMNAFSPRSEEQYLAKIDLLLEYGATEEDILDCLGTLNRSLKCLLTRCREVEQLGLAKEGLPLKLLNQGRNNYNAMIKYRKNTLEVLGTHADAWHCLAQKLDASPELVKQRIRPFDLVGTVQKIDLLLEMGITKDDIVLRPRLVSFSVASILRAKQIIDDHDLDISAASLSYFLEKNTFPTKQTKFSMMDAICVLLNCHMSELRDMFKFLQPALNSNITSIERSIKFLVGKDITLAEITACPLVLNYDVDSIEKAFASRHMDPVSQWKNNIQLLNALVYSMGHQEAPMINKILPDDGAVLALNEDDYLEEEVQEFVLDEEETFLAQDWLPSKFTSYGFTM